MKRKKPRWQLNLSLLFLSRSAMLESAT